MNISNTRSPLFVTTLLLVTLLFVILPLQATLLPMFSQPLPLPPTPLSPLQTPPLTSAPVTPTVFGAMQGPINPTNKTLKAEPSDSVDSSSASSAARSKASSAPHRTIRRDTYHDRLQGFWLGTSIANWTGLVTEMDKIGGAGAPDNTIPSTGPFYTRHDWGAPDQPSIWGEGQPSALSPTIDFVYAAADSIWGADDDTDIEYMYQELLLRNETSILSGEQIRDGWLRHIRPDEENYLWVANQRAFDLMNEGVVPPETGDPHNNLEYEMIDAQLTTEIFGLFAPGRPDIAQRMAELPIRTVARQESEWIAQFYVMMFSLAAGEMNAANPLKNQLFAIADQAKTRLPQNSYPRSMYEFVQSKYEQGIPWEQARDSVYVRYQVEGRDGYDLTSRNLYCNGCFAAGINFAASLISLFYGEGDLLQTIRIGTLAGWDSDNPTATWGGLIGFMLGKNTLTETFETELPGVQFSNRFHIHRTRTGFENNGIDTFENMADKGLRVVDRVVREEMNGRVDLENNVWIIPEGE